MNTQTQNALTLVDGFNDQADTSNSPIRGIGFRLKDDTYVSFSDEFPTAARTFLAIDKIDGWQKLTKGQPPEYVMRQSGKARPPQPHVDQKDWPNGFDGKPAHPWVLTRYLYLLDTTTGEISTFYSSTIGGRIALDELAEQVKTTRSIHPDAIPVISLGIKSMPTKFGGEKPRPYFKIAGYKLRSNLGSQQLLTDETKAPAAESSFDDPLDDFEPQKPAAKSKKKAEVA